VQWQMLIAVGYPARDAGVRRGASAADAVRACPDIRLVHVETVDADGAVHAQDHVEDSARRGASSSGTPTEKASLRRYRRASEAIFDVLAHVCHPAAVAKASIDEAYVNLGPAVDALVRDRGAAPLPRLAAFPPAVAVDEVVGEMPEGPPEEENAWAAWHEEMKAVAARRHREAAAVMQRVVRGDDGVTWEGLELPEDWVVEGRPAAGEVTPAVRRLLVAAGLVAQIRAALLHTLGFVTSAGVSVNKMLSKVAAGRHKPDRLTVPLPGFDTMADMPLRDVPLLGGVLGRSLEQLAGGKGATVLAARGLSLAQLRRALGDERGMWVFRRLRGVDTEGLEARTRVKTLLAAKNFGQVVDLAAIDAKLHLLCLELLPRLDHDAATNRRVAKVLAVSWRQSRAQARLPSVTKSHQGRLPSIPARSDTSSPYSMDQIWAFSKSLARRISADLPANGFPCSWLAIRADTFAPWREGGAAAAGGVVDLLRRQQKRTRDEDGEGEGEEAEQGEEGEEGEHGPPSQPDSDSCDSVVFVEEVQGPAHPSRAPASKRATLAAPAPGAASGGGIRKFFTHDK
jgi:DNA polymerase eta